MRKTLDDLLDPSRFFDDAAALLARRSTLAERLAAVAKGGAMRYRRWPLR